MSIMNLVNSGKSFKEFSESELLSIAHKAHASMYNSINGGSRGGCGRVYIEFVETIRVNSKVKKIFERAGFKMTKRPMFSGVRIYVGYDNATGKEFSMADKAFEVLKSYGIHCYVDGDGD